MPASQAGGREANALGEIPARGWKDILWRVFWQISGYRILATSGGVALFALLAIFPAVATIVSLYGLFADTSTIRGHLTLLAGILPGGVLELIGGQISLIVTQGNDTLGVAFIVGLLVALWSANSRVAAHFDALNVIYGEKQKRSLLRFYATTFLLTLGMIGFIIPAIGAVVAAPIGLKLSVNLHGQGKLIPPQVWVVATDGWGRLVFGKSQDLKTLDHCHTL